jgi:succinoglycan biosynthesis protein ExoW
MGAQVAVVIPYFQREPGLLARALGSITHQVGCEPPAQIIVVDDESPVPADGELTGLPDTWRSRVELVRQDNAGPGAARNVALNRVRDDVEYVAFLDSDDEWADHHLRTALSVLEQGFDIFFGDHLDADATEGWIARNWPQVLEMPRLEVGEACYRHTGDFASQILWSNPIAMPGAVYRYRAYPDQRFPIDFPTAEVNVFWLQLALRGARVACSTAIHARLGRGVNVYRGHEKASAASLGVLHNSTRFRRLALNELQLSDSQRDVARRRMNVFAQRFAAELVPLLKSPQAVPWRTVLRQCRTAPRTVSSCFSELFRRARRVRTPVD